MNFHRLRQPLAVWLAVLIVVLGTLLPTLSLATSGTSTSTQAMVEICSSNGSHWVSADSSPNSSGGPESGLSANHCPLCLHHADRVLPPPRALSQGFGTVGEHVAPTIGQAFLFITVPARVPPPRGPPVFL